MSERYTTARTPSARPYGAPSKMAGVYDGAELRTTSSRPGAYDAMRLPSLVNGRPEPRTAPVALAMPQPRPLSERSAYMPIDPTAAAALPRYVNDEPPAPTPTAQQQRADAYKPKDGGLVDLVVAELRHLGPEAGLTYAEICARHGTSAKGTPSCFAAALRSGAVIRVTRRGRIAIALPGASEDEPTATPPTPPTPTPAEPTAEVRQAIALLEGRKRQLALMTAYVAGLRARAQFDALSALLEAQRPYVPALNSDPAA